LLTAEVGNATIKGTTKGHIMESEDRKSGQFAKWDPEKYRWEPVDPADVTIEFSTGSTQMEVPPLIPEIKPMDVKFPSILPEPLKKPTAYWEFKSQS
jgi:hypothetical protein